MFVANGQVLRVQLCGTWRGQEFCVGFNYKHPGELEFIVDMPLPDWRDEFVTRVVNVLRTASHETCAYTLLRFQNLDSTNQFGEIPIAVSGTRTGDPTASFVAANVFLGRSTKITRSGRKAIPGLSEIDVFGNDFSNPTVRNAIAQACNNDLIPLSTEDVPIVLGPVIVGTDAFGKPDTNRVNFVTQAQVRGVSTQNSRKPYKGR
jgi:hypothetical protein